eukprot:13761101-Alexandrium_andersonii.AAC.1
MPTPPGRAPEGMKSEAGFDRPKRFRIFPVYGRGTACVLQLGVNVGRSACVLQLGANFASRRTSGACS